MDQTRQTDSQGHRRGAVDLDVDDLGEATRKAHLLQLHENEARLSRTPFLQFRAWCSMTAWILETQAPGRETGAGGGSGRSLFLLFPRARVLRAIAVRGKRHISRPNEEQRARESLSSFFYEYSKERSCSSPTPAIDELSAQGASLCRMRAPNLKLPWR